MTFLQDVHPWVTKLPLGANVKHYDILIAPLDIILYLANVYENVGMNP